jgi:poly(A) polymerase
VALPVKGQDAVDLGVPAGPEVGRLLAEVEKWWEEGDYRASRAEGLEKLKALIGARRTGR